MVYFVKFKESVEDILGIELVMFKFLVDVFVKFCLVEDIKYDY